MPTTDRDLVQRLSIDDDPLFKILGGLLKPVLSISAAVTVGPLGAMSAALLTEAIGQIEASIKSKEEERTKEMLMGLNEGLAQQGFSPEDLVRRIEALSSQNKVILFNIVERAYASTKTERIDVKRKIVRQFLQDTLVNLSSLNLGEREFFESILLDLSLTDLQVLSILKNSRDKVHPSEISISGVAHFYIISSILNLEKFALIRTVKQGMSVGGELVNPNSGWWVGISEDGKRFYEYCLSSSDEIVNPS